MNFEPVERASSSGIEEVVAVAVEVGADAAVEVGQGQAQHAAGREHPPQLQQRRQQVGVAQLRQGVDADRVVDAARLQRQPLEDVAADVDGRVVLDVGVDPARLRLGPAAPVEAADRWRPAHATASSSSGRTRSESKRLSASSRAAALWLLVGALDLRDRRRRLLEVGEASRPVAGLDLALEAGRLGDHRLPARQVTEAPVAEPAAARAHVHVFGNAHLCAGSSERRSGSRSSSPPARAEPAASRPRAGAPRRPRRPGRCRAPAPSRRRWRRAGSRTPASGGREGRSARPRTRSARRGRARWRRSCRRGHRRWPATASRTTGCGVRTHSTPQVGTELPSSPTRSPTVA